MTKCRSVKSVVYDVIAVPIVHLVAKIEVNKVHRAVRYARFVVSANHNKRVILVPKTLVYADVVLLWLVAYFQLVLINKQGNERVVLRRAYKNYIVVL